MRRGSLTGGVGLLVAWPMGLHPPMRAQGGQGRWTNGRRFSQAYCCAHCCQTPRDAAHRARSVRTVTFIYAAGEAGLQVTGPTSTSVRASVAAMDGHLLRVVVIPPA